MARPREFDESEALDRALATFWRRGYAACSIRDLVAATGLQRQSLYNTFGDKAALFLKALQRYRKGVEESLAPLNREDAGLQSIRAYMQGVLEGQRQGHFGACLLVKTAFSPEMGDAQIRLAVESGAARVRSAFAKVIRAALRRGELAKSVDPVSYAAYLYALLNGLSALTTTGGSGSATDLAAALAHAFPR
jgi:TetR/AcrR family transcriptional repressor of nem operon